MESCSGVSMTGMGKKETENFQELFGGGEWQGICKNDHLARHSQQERYWNEPRGTAAGDKSGARSEQACLESGECELGSYPLGVHCAF